MPLGTEWPCPYTEDICSRGCPATACRRDLDEASWPDCEPDELDLANVEWPMACSDCGCPAGVRWLCGSGRAT